MKKINILIVAAVFYKEICDSMVEEVKKKYKTLEKPKIQQDSIKHKIKIIYVPGIFEIPVVIQRNIKKYEGVIALGCVIKGETPHFDFISKSTTDAIMKLSIDHKKPIGNAIITCLNIKQAKVRIKKANDAVNAVESVLDKKNIFDL
jgi:6,7-dimethyl-8-ribityllumazine synthase